MSRYFFNKIQWKIIYKQYHENSPSQHTISTLADSNNQQQRLSNTKVAGQPGTFIIFQNYLSSDYRNFNEKSTILKG